MAGDRGSRPCQRDAHFARDGKPKRILSLDGGGLRGICTLGMLERVEELLRRRHGGGPTFRLCDYFDLIAGTSTGAIIASMIALGWSVAEIVDRYTRLGSSVFERSPLRRGVLRAKYDAAKLETALKEALGAERTLGSEDIRTGLLIVTKRVDTASPWPLINNPNGPYFQGDPEQGVLGNRDYPLWSVVRASTAAPTYFDPERIRIAGGIDRTPVEGHFVDGGVSPHNDPSLCALLFATVAGCRIGWETGADRLLVVSLGTGRRAAQPGAMRLAAGQGIQALGLLMDDCAALVQTIMQWMSTGPTRQHIDGDLGDLADDFLCGQARFCYARYDVDLELDAVRELERAGGIPAGSDEHVMSLSAMDAPENMATLLALGRAKGRRDITDDAFPPAFDVR